MLIISRDDTAIVIIGDHNIPEEADVNSLDDDRVPLIIINSPLRVPKGIEATQADLFPTIMDIMGLHYKYKGIPYKGLGKSIFDTTPGTLTNEDYRVSEMIIKGNMK